MKYFIYSFLMLLGFQSCSQVQKETPEQFKHVSIISKTRYNSDSLDISSKLNNMVNLHKDFFYPYSPVHVDTTQSKVIIDTIFFSNKMNKIFILLIVKSVRKEYRKFNGDKVQILNNFTAYDGIGVIAKRKEDNSIIFKSYNIDVSNYENSIDCSSRLREIYFKEIPSFKQENYNRYNIDDKRMWEEPMWDKF